jgi:hypothetical protein
MSPPLTQTVNTVPGGGFQSVVIYPAGNSPHEVAVGDFNGDGKADVAVADYSCVNLLLGNGDGTFQAAVAYACDVSSGQIGASDFNGDGNEDLVVTNSDDGLTALLGNGDGTLQPPLSSAALISDFPISMAVADFNGDGKPDIAVVNYSYPPISGTVSVLLGAGDGTFPAVVNYVVGAGPTSIAVGDFNGDGKADIAVTYWDDANPIYVSVLLGNGDGTFQAPANYWAGGGSYCVVVGDFNGDAKLDIAVANLAGSGGVTVLLGNGDGTFEPAISSADGAGGQSISVADVNGDGKEDLIAFGATSDVSVLLGNGDGTFQSTGRYETNGASSVAVANFDGDGRADLATASGGVGVLLGTPAGESFTTLVAPLNPLTYGQAETLTATVSPLTATGTVSFYSGLAGLGKIGLVSGIATLTISTLPAGIVSLTAVYNGDASNSPSTSPIVNTIVNQAPTYTGLASSFDPSTFGQNLTLTASVSSTTATGTVSFYDGVTDLGKNPLTNGIATLSISTLTPGTHLISAAYSGDNNYAASSSPVVTETIQAATPVTLSSSANPSTFGQSVTFTATVSSSGATGKVTFSGGATVLGASPLFRGAATLSTSALALGAHSITASYSGDTSHASGSSGALIQQVQDYTLMTLTSSLNPSAFGQTVTFTAGVWPPTATGAVTFYDGPANIGATTLTNGIATLALSTLTAGSHSISAAYGGDANDEANTSPVLFQVVKASTVTTLTSSPNPSKLGQAVTLTATVAPSTATGAVTFYYGSSVLGTGALNGGIATTALSTLPAGTHLLTATYGGDANYAPSTPSSPMIQTTVKPCPSPATHPSDIGGDRGRCFAETDAAGAGTNGGSAK